MYLREVLKNFGHIATKDGDNFERLIETGKVDGKRLQYFGPTGSAPLLIPQFTKPSIPPETETEKDHAREIYTEDWS